MLFRPKHLIIEIFFVILECCMNHRLISELTVKTLVKADEGAVQDMEELFDRPFFEGVVKGEDRSGWIGKINVGLWPTNDGFEKRYIIHTSLEGTGYKRRNVEVDKIKGFFMAKHVMRAMMDESRTVYTPAIKGQKVIHDDRNRDLRIREIYTNYEPRILAYNDKGIAPDDYSFFLGRDMARFMYVGMTNAPRHIRPNYSRPSVRKTCMIDLDTFDPRTFYWNTTDRHSHESLNYQVLIKHETNFFHDVGLYFLHRLLPDAYKSDKKMIQKLRSCYLQGFAQEINNIKGSRQSDSIVSRFRF